MNNYEKREIKCPNKIDHKHKKLLLLIGDSDISVFCKDHGWIKIELHKGGSRLNFEGVSAKITSYGKKPSFDLNPMPAIALGKFKHRKKANG